MVCNLCEKKKRLSLRFYTNHITNDIIINPIAKQIVTPNANIIKMKSSCSPNQFNIFLIITDILKLIVHGLVFPFAGYFSGTLSYVINGIYSYPLSMLS